MKHPYTSYFTMTKSPTTTRLISAREWRTVLIYALVLILLTSIPYWLGWRNSTEEREFSGFLLGVDDGNSYIAKMRLGARGLWDFHLFYTAEPHDSSPLIFLPYIIPGQIIGLFVSDTDPALHGILVGTYHLLRFVFGFFLILVMYRFIAGFLALPKTRFLALVLATLGGGLGWLAIIAGALPPEFYIPEGFSFLILYSLPHLALARAFLLLGLLAIFPYPIKSVGALHVTPLQNNQLFPAFIAGLCWLIVGLCVPFYLVILYCILGAWGLTIWIRRRAFPVDVALRCIVAGLVTLPLFLYNVYVFSANPAFAQWSAQNLLPSPAIWQYALAYAPLGTLAWFGGKWAWRRAKSDPRYALFIGWPLIVPMLVYLPLNVQRRMAEAVIIPLAILAAAGVRLLAKRFRQANRRTFWTWERTQNTVLALTTLNSIFVLLGGLASASSNSAPIFRPLDEIAAFDWLNANAPADSVVLSAFETGNALPSYTNLRVYVGHGPETLYAVPKTHETERFFRGEMMAEEHVALYQSMGIDYIFYGKTEKHLASPADVTLPVDVPEWAEGLQKIYANGLYEIYEVGDNR